MRARASNGGVTVSAFAGTHVVTLGFDLSAAKRQGCLGFAIQREDHSEDERAWMRGMKTFEETDPGIPPGGNVSSREHPFQGFQWADYSAKPDHEYTYTVIPLRGTPSALKEGPRASVRVRTESELGARHSVFFNRGAVASQEYARTFLNEAPDDIADPTQRKAAYDWLSRGLLEALVAFIQRAEDPDFALHAAIYEFQWPAALAAFAAASARGATVDVLYDGIGGASGPRDANVAAIKAAGIEAICRPRTTGSLMHNKFVVLSHKGRPIAVWTGSTNLTENGIFGHLNCGHIVEGAAVAERYKAYFDELATNPVAKAERAWMGEHNPAPPEPWSDDLTTVFSPHSGNSALDWYAQIAGTAKQALFMTFAFGMDTRFRGVYGTDDDLLRIALMEKEGTGSEAQVATATKAIRDLQRRPNVLVAIGQPIAVNSFDRWLAERDSGLGTHVQWVHTKFMLVDPLSDAPTVITGSANFSQASTSTNNENMLVIRGDTRVADIYLGEFMRIYAHYAFREAVAISRKRGETSWHPNHLATDASWQSDYFTPGDDRDLRRRYFVGAP
jgi:phosphatidylserine/phosphatidylglycerophosphate/cardiolipin synthase-like enzyme